MHFLCHPYGFTFVILTEDTGADPKFEIRVPSHLSERDFGCGVPKSPFVRPVTGLGGRGHFRGETRSRKLPIWALTCGYFKDLD